LGINDTPLQWCPLSEEVATKSMTKTGMRESRMLEEPTRKAGLALGTGVKTGHGEVRLDRAASPGEDLGANSP